MFIQRNHVLKRVATSIQIWSTHTPINLKYYLFTVLDYSLSLWLYFLWHISCWFISSCLCPCCGNLTAKALHTTGSDTINPTLLNKPKNQIKIVYVHVTGVLSAWLPLLGHIICWIISTCYWWVCGTYHRCEDIAEWIPLPVYHQCVLNWSSIMHTRQCMKRSSNWWLSLAGFWCVTCLTVMPRHPMKSAKLETNTPTKLVI